MVFSYLVQKAGKGQNGIWGDQIVIDWKEEAEKTYGFQVNTLRRGRGSWILETNQGLRLLKEYRGSVLLICHEPEFYQDVVSQVWDCSKWTTRV